MSTGNAQRSVLVLGRSQRVIDEALVGLRELGYTAQGTNDFLGDITGRFDPSRLDLVVMGGQVPPERKAELREEIGAINPRVIFVDGLAGIPGLLVHQIEGAFNGHVDPAWAPTYAPEDRTIRITLADPADVKVTVWWTAAVVAGSPESDSQQLFDGRLAGGEHAIPVPERVPPDGVFATVKIDAATYAFSIATE